MVVLDTSGLDVLAGALLVSWSTGLIVGVLVRASGCVIERRFSLARIVVQGSYGAGFGPQSWFASWAL